jgi:hypothetical protein
MDNSELIKEIRLEVRKLCDNTMGLSSQRNAFTGLLLSLIENFDINLSYQSRKHLLQQIIDILKKYQTDYDGSVILSLEKTHGLIQSNEAIDKALGIKDYGI